jgi:DNA-binding NarL/FixJ family response regulator
MHLIIADDHPFTLTGLKTYIEDAGYVVLAACSNGTEAYNAIKKLKPDYAILDIRMPGMDGLELLENIKFANLPTKVVLLTNYNEMSLFKKATLLGAKGYLLKNYAKEELVKCLRQIEKEGTYVSDYLSNDLIMDTDYEKHHILQKLSFVERKVFEMIVQQKSNKETAELLFLSEKTVEAHKTSIIEKLSLPKERNSLLKFAMRFTRG